MKIAYIYALIDPRDDTVRYIGKTIDPKKRMISHLTESRLANNNNHRLNWIRKLSSLGVSPIFRILKICDISEYTKYESYYINIYKSDKLTNSDDTGQGNVGRRRSIIEESSKKISKVVYQFDLDGKFIQEFISTRDAARKLNTYHSSISRCCNFIAKHHNGFIYSYDRNIIIEKISEPNSIRKIVIEVDNKGVIINEWVSLMDCARDTNLDNGNLSRVCNGKRKSHHGRYFKFK